MLDLAIIIVVAVVVIYIIRSVKPKRVRLRAGVGKITILDFEADEGGQSGESDGERRRGHDQKELPPGLGAVTEHSDIKSLRHWNMPIWM